ncbi:MAG: hypothetical protein ACFNYQ_03535 [Treponema sp.]|jgi:hypothetical protein|uniref:hypothetical protein n=1 Tax=Treponema sp. TaxID=166 RepID=UPI0028E3271E|nr:hypothetical protein [uncultured Treponema sp.]
MRKGKREPLYINGLFYKSFFIANIETGISGVSFWKTLKNRHGYPATIQGNFVATAIWVQTRKAAAKMRYGL